VHLLKEAPPAQSIEHLITSHKGPHFPKASDDKVASEIHDKKRRADQLDCLYEPVVAWMRENSRDSVLVVEEEISYGFQRNFFALKLFAFICVVASLLVEAIAAHLRGQLAWPIITHIDSSIAAAILSALVAYLIFLVFFVTENSVKVQGFIYARALLDSFYGAASPTQPAAKTGNGKSS
jgi:hypothetical protein